MILKNNFSKEKNPNICQTLLVTHVVIIYLHIKNKIISL